MKLVTRKTRKKIAKTVRKAMKKHGDALMASLATGLASSIATLAKTQSPVRPGKSNLADVVDRAKESVADGRKKARTRLEKKGPSRTEQAVT